MSNPADLRITAAYLADYAKVEGTGLISVIGGGIARMTASVFPVPYTVYLVTQILRLHPGLAELPVEVQVVSPSGAQALKVGGHLEFGPDGDSLNLPIGLSVLIDMPGRWIFTVVFADGAARADVPLDVSQGDAAAAGSAGG